MKARRAILGALLVMLAPGLAGAQERGALPDLPSEVEERVRDMREDATAIRMDGPVTVEAGRTIESGLVVEGGALTLEGRVLGDLLVTGGDLTLGSAAEVVGDVLVVGGEIHGIETATVTGTLQAYGVARPTVAADRRRAERDDEEWNDEKDDDDDDWTHRHRDRDDDGGLDLGLSIAGNYNRVEGLPVMFGPVIETMGDNRLHISAQAIWRTEPSASLRDEIGYHVRAEQGLFGNRLRVGGETSSRTHAIERRGLNSTEAGIAAAVFHSDPHDYYQAQGWSAYAQVRPRDFPLEARIEYRQAEHGVLEVSDPWSLFRGDDDWRLQPVVAGGDLSSLLVRLDFDTRDDEDEPMRGVFASASVEHALDQDLLMPEVFFEGATVGGSGFEDFTVARLDLRAHLPVNRTATLNLRALATGAVDEAMLPPQFQHALGGIGTLPGFRIFEGACGSRDAAVALVSQDTAGMPIVSDQAMRPSYGCDRVVLGQLEYRGGFGARYRERHEDDDEWYDDFDMHPDWAFFVNVGQGWSFGDIGFAQRVDTETMADVGIGLLFDHAGVYVALPVTGEDQSLRVVARLERRF